MKKIIIGLIILHLSTNNLAYFFFLLTGCWNYQIRSIIRISWYYNYLTVHSSGDEYVYYFFFYSFSLGSSVGITNQLYTLHQANVNLLIQKRLLYKSGIKFKSRSLLLKETIGGYLTYCPLQLGNGQFFFSIFQCWQLSENFFLL